MHLPRPGAEAGPGAGPAPGPQQARQRRPVSPAALRDTDAPLRRDRNPAALPPPAPAQGAARNGRLADRRAQSMGSAHGVASRRRAADRPAASTQRAHANPRHADSPPIPPQPRQGLEMVRRRDRQRPAVGQLGQRAESAGGAPPQTRHLAWRPMWRPPTAANTEWTHTRAHMSTAQCEDDSRSSSSKQGVSGVYHATIGVGNSCLHPSNGRLHGALLARAEARTTPHAPAAHRSRRNPPGTRQAVQAEPLHRAARPTNGGTPTCAA